MGSDLSRFGFVGAAVAVAVVLVVFFAAVATWRRATVAFARWSKSVASAAVAFAAEVVDALESRPGLLTAAVKVESRLR